MMNLSLTKLTCSVLQYNGKFPMHHNTGQLSLISDRFAMNNN